MDVKLIILDQMLDQKKAPFSVKEAIYVPLEFVFSNQFIIDLKRLNALVFKLKESYKFKNK